MGNSKYDQLRSVFKDPQYQQILFAILFLLVLLTAAGLRFYKLGEWSFWEDEAFSIGSEDDGFNSSIWRQSFAVQLIQLMVTWRGATEWNARFFPALIGVLSIPILFFPVKRLFGNRTAFLFILLLAFSTWHLYWSQNARFYTLLLLFYSLAVLAFYYGFEQDRPWIVLLSLVFLALATRERLVAVFFYPSAFLYLAALKLAPFEKPSGFNLRNIIIFFLPGLIFGLLFAGQYLQNLPGWIESFRRINTSPLWVLAGVVYYVGIATVLWAGFSAGYLLIRKERAALFFIIFALTPLFAVMLLSLVHYAANRYVFMTLTSWLILASLGLHVFLAELHGRRKIFGAAVLAILLLLPASENFLYFQVQNGNRANWKAAFEYIKDHKQPGDLVFTTGSDVGAYYLGEGESRDYQYFEPNGSLPVGNSIWFIEDLVLEELYPAHRAWVLTNTQLTASYDVAVKERIFKMRVYKFEQGE